MLQILNRTAQCSNEFQDRRIQRLKETLSNETGPERIKRMFSPNEYGVMSPELLFIIKNCSALTAITALGGGLICMLKAKEDYLRKNVASKYESQYLARRHLQDNMTLAGIKGGIKYGIRYGIFSSIYLLGVMTAANYNNKMTVWEHIGTGAVLGSLFRISYGLKGMMAAGVLGGCLGAIAGSTLLMGMKIAGTSFEEQMYINSEQYYTMKMRKRTD